MGIVEGVWDDVNAVHDAVGIMYWEVGAVWGFPCMGKKVLGLCIKPEP